ncbi:XAC0095 family protein [Coralloluteibacterium thermophilus]|uniref:XAC0095 family protein n=1 Tax=Coralloluteibacterium thermophilum TaxID=2707049 RepID=A0ABV9NQR8_9GAMM
MDGTSDRGDTLGYLLPEDSQFRLKKLQQHMAFLSHLAQPRTADEEREWAPEVSMGEVAICLELLAEQVSIVLDEVAWPARLQGAQERAERDAEHAGDDDAAAIAAAMEAPDAGGGRFTFGVTLEQVDTLARLVQAISAHGDVLAVGHAGELAAGTLPQLGQAICDAAEALRRVLDEVEEQRLGKAPGRNTQVEEERGEYRVGATPSAAAVLAGSPVARASAVGPGATAVGAWRVHRRARRPPLRGLSPIPAFPRMAGEGA